MVTGTRLRQRRRSAAVAVAALCALLAAGCSQSSGASADVSREAGADELTGPAVPRHSGTSAVAPLAVGNSALTAQALLSVQKIKVVKTEDDWGADEPVLGVIGFQMRAGDQNSLKTFMFADNGINEDCEGRLHEIGSANDGQEVDVPDEYGDHVFTVQPWTPAQSSGEQKTADDKLIGPPVVGMLAVALDGDASNACTTWKRVRSFEGELEKQLKQTLGTVQLDNLDNSAERLKATARSLSQGFSATAETWWMKILGFGTASWGDQDDYVGTNFSAFLIAEDKVADEIELNDRVFSQDSLTKVGLLRPSPDEPYERTWEGTAKNTDLAVEYVLKNYAHVGWSPVQIRNTATDLCIDSPGGADAKGTQLVGYACNGSAAQRVKFDKGQSLVLRGRCLDAKDGGTAPGTPIQLWECNGTASQKFTFDGAQIKVAGMCLQVAEGSSNPPIVLASCDASSARQQFALKSL
ncbi:MAG: RICIN domain-containing protein [Candidatus Nanopelagicales bacterium]